MVADEEAQEDESREENAGAEANEAKQEDEIAEGAPLHRTFTFRQPCVLTCVQPTSNPTVPGPGEGDNSQQGPASSDGQGPADAPPPSDGQGPADAPPPTDEPAQSDAPADGPAQSDAPADAYDALVNDEPAQSTGGGGGGFPSQSTGGGGYPSQHTGGGGSPSHGASDGIAQQQQEQSDLPPPDGESGCASGAFSRCSRLRLACVTFSLEGGAISAETLLKVCPSLGSSKYVRVLTPSCVFVSPCYCSVFCAARSEPRTENN